MLEYNYGLDFSRDKQRLNNKKGGDAYEEGNSQTDL